MGKYIYAPAVNRQMQADKLRKCIEYIGSTQAGRGSNYAKGKRYLRSTLASKHIYCSGKAIKRTIQTYPKLINYPFEIYGIDVYYYHKDVCVEIVKEVVHFIINHSNDEIKSDIFGFVPTRNSFTDQVYGHRIARLKWVRNQNFDGQRSDADSLCNDFDALVF